jgi:type II secretory pathway predicted ATPase ExeA
MGKTGRADVSIAHGVPVYAHYFGLRELPFNNTPDPRFFFPTPDHDEALATLIYAVSESKGFAALTGEVGTGKTLISRLMLRHFGARISSACVNHACASARDLIYLIGVEFQLDVDAEDSPAELIRRLQDYLLAKYAANTPAVLVLDEAQALPPDALEMLRTIGNLEADNAKLLQVVILGQPELRRWFRSREAKPLRQRVFRFFHLPALNREQCAGYVRHRLQVAGGENPELFAPSTMDLIYGFSQGLPRAINTLCDNALLSAYAADRATIERSFLQTVLDEMMAVHDAGPDVGDDPAPAGTGLNGCARSASSRKHPSGAPRNVPDPRAARLSRQPRTPAAPSRGITRARPGRRANPPSRICRLPSRLLEQLDGVERKVATLERSLRTGSPGHSAFPDGHDPSGPKQATRPDARGPDRLTRLLQRSRRSWEALRAAIQEDLCGATQSPDASRRSAGFEQPAAAARASSRAATSE